jgi:23S rRNA-/tRNA-specific pseudouridylate synthase
LIEARPRTGRTHQIRVHLAQSGCPVLGDSLYGSEKAAGTKAAPISNLALRATYLAYVDPFTGKRVSIRAPTDAFLAEFGFAD